MNRSSGTATKLRAGKILSSNKYSGSSGRKVRVVLFTSIQNLYVR